jgi:hypothetical protein
MSARTSALVSLALVASLALAGRPCTAERTEEILDPVVGRWRRAPARARAASPTDREAVTSAEAKRERKRAARLARGGGA